MARRLLQAMAQSALERTNMHWIDPKFLPQINAVFERFIINRRGYIDGLVVSHGHASLLVHVPPHLHEQIECAVRPDDMIQIRGVRLRGMNAIAAIAITTADRTEIVDHGPDHTDKHKAEETADEAEEDASLDGLVRLPLFGPKGELRGALLTDGTVLRVGPEEAKLVGHLLAAGASLAVRGKRLVTKHCTVVTVAEIGSNATELQPIKKQAKPEKHKKKKSKGSVEEHSAAETAALQ
jgi:hypothetical protein